MSLSLLIAAAVAAAPAPSAPAPPPPVVTSANPPAAGAPQPVALADTLKRGLAPTSGGLTADAVAERALAVAPSVAIKDAAIERAASRVDQTIIQFLPQIGGKAGYTRLSKAAINFGSGGSFVAAQNGPGGGSQFQPVVVGPCDATMPTGPQCVLDPGGVPIGVTPPLQIAVPLNSWSLQAQLSIPLSDYILSLTPAKRGTKAARESAEAARDAERLKVQTDARLTYYNWVRAIAALTVLEDALARTQARLIDVQNLFEAGAATRSDVLRVDALVSSQQAAIVEATAFRNVLAQSLSVMMNEEFREYTIGEDVLARPRDIGTLPDVDKLISEAQQNRLEVRSLESAIVGTEMGIRATRAGYYPRLDAFAEATYANPNQRFFPLQSVWRASWSAGFSLSYTINQTLMTKARVREQKSDKRELFHQLELMRRGIAMEVAQAYGDRVRALAAIELNTKALASSAEAYRVASESYAAGAATTNEIIDAEGQQVQASLMAVNAHIDLRAANARLLYATGRLDKTRAAGK
ncbi:MAG: TolC family protein [Myxococcales bacterium]|nr:TolC family protein [Myxococcales bacterium]